MGKIMNQLIEVLNGLNEYIIWLEEDITANYVCRYANKAFLKRLGYKRADIFDRSISHFLTKPNFQQLSALLKNLKSKDYKESKIKSLFSLSFKRIHRQGFVELACYATCSQLKGNPLILLWCTENDNLYKSALRNSQLYEESLDGIFTLHQSGEIENGNKKIEQMVGRRSGRLTVDLFKRFISEQEAIGLVNYLTHRLKGEMNNYPFYISIKSPDGNEKHYSVRAIDNPITERAIIVYIRDITDSKRLENDLRESESKYRTVVEHSQDIIFLAKTDKIILVNSVANKVMGRQLRYPHTHWRDYQKNIIPEDRERVIDFLTQSFKAIADGREIENQSSEFRVRLLNGETNYEILTISSIPYHGEKVLLGTIRDITESKKLEAKTTEATKLGTLAQFSASVAHEIRNPLEALGSAGLLLSRSLDLEGDNQKLLNAIINATADIDAVVQQFVSMTTVPEYHFSETNIRSLLKSVVRYVKVLPSYKQSVEIIVSHQRGVPEIQCDAAQLHTTLCNIITNACNAIKDKGIIRIRVESFEFESKNALKLTIKDSGEGIAPDELDHIWEPFFTRKKKGMGLGLFIAKHCIEAHGGNVSIPYSNKRGTKFQIILPVQQK